MLVTFFFFLVVHTFVIPTTFLNVPTDNGLNNLAPIIVYVMTRYPYSYLDLMLIEHLNTILLKLKNRSITLYLGLQVKLNNLKSGDKYTKVMLNIQNVGLLFQYLVYKILEYTLSFISFLEFLKILGLNNTLYQLFKEYDYIKYLFSNRQILLVQQFKQYVQNFRINTSYHLITKIVLCSILDYLYFDIYLDPAKSHIYDIFNQLEQAVNYVNKDIHTPIIESLKYVIDIFRRLIVAIYSVVENVEQNLQYCCKNLINLPLNIYRAQKW